jgi:hypothetical protein
VGGSATLDRDPPARRQRGTGSGGRGSRIPPGLLVFCRPGRPSQPSRRDGMRARLSRHEARYALMVARRLGCTILRRGAVHGPRPASWSPRCWQHPAGHGLFVDDSRGSRQVRRVLVSESNDSVVMFSQRNASALPRQWGRERSSTSWSTGTFDERETNSIIRQLGWQNGSGHNASSQRRGVCQRLSSDGPGFEG